MKEKNLESRAPTTQDEDNKILKNPFSPTCNTSSEWGLNLILERHVGSLENGFQVAGLKQLVTTSLENVFDLFEDANVVDGSRGIRMIKRL